MKLHETAEITDENEKNLDLDQSETAEEENSADLEVGLEKTEKIKKNLEED